MNAFIAAVLEKKTILVANEGRLLKKSFLGIVILAMAFQTNSFGEMIRSSLVDAYLQVSVFVGFTLFIFIGLDSLTKFNISYILNKTKKYHVAISSLLGAFFFAVLLCFKHLWLYSAPVYGIYLFLSHHTHTRWW